MEKKENYVVFIFTSNDMNRIDTYDVSGGAMKKIKF